MKFFGLFIVIAVGIFFAYQVYKSGRWRKPKSKEFPADWVKFLVDNVSFYKNLSEKEKGHFEFKVSEFLENVKITGIKTNVAYSDQLLIASSAVIPIFAFPNWQYRNLNEVLLYPNSFGNKFELEGEGRRIMGMVGNGNMNGKMILSKQSLKHGFRNESDKRNTAIHEFVHLIDMADGQVDGIPEVLLEKQYIIPWLRLIEETIKEIEDGEAKINPYGATSRVEFFSVLSEYFFERPQLLEKKHPELYEMLVRIFDTDLE